jgi:hypothetical protein
LYLRLGAHTVAESKRSVAIDMYFWWLEKLGERDGIDERAGVYFLHPRAEKLRR